MTNHLDLLIIGSGPAGLAAAVSAHSCGLDIGLVDEQAHVGGQIFRNIHMPYIDQILDKHDKELGQKLVSDFKACNIEYFPQTTVWGMEAKSRKNEIFCKKDGKSHTITASKVIYAVGGMERPVPFKGWTLPGVMTAGATEVIMRSGGKIMGSENGVVLAGNGPLLISLANHLLDQKIPILAWLDTGRFANKLKSLIHMGFVFGDMPYFKKGMSMALRILKSKIPLIQGVTKIEALGTNSVNSIRYYKKNTWHEIKTNALIRHENIIPRNHIANALELELSWDNVQRYWYPKTDFYGRTSLNDIFMAGDCGFVNGGEAAINKGYISGIAAAKDLGVLSAKEEKEKNEKYVKKLKHLIRARKYLQHVFAPNPEVYNVDDDVTVCRCECISAKEIRKAVSEGYTSPDEVKRVTRSGMGPCQGRMCANAMAEIISQEIGVEIEKVGQLNCRQPFAPVTLGDYCNLHTK